ncbi:MAG TPA: DUF1028 domain-containing protein [Gaiellales bacterium]|nr:DUF1028 domain-containing protein [Gaiellales bacterium]
MTYSIVARDGDGRMGVAVQTCVMGVGAICPWARAGVGVVATQAFSLAGYGPRLLDRLSAGESAAAALGALAAADERRNQRQVAVLAADGATAAFTGSDTIPFAGDAQGDGFSCQANMMAAPGVPEAMRDAFVASEGALQRRLLAAMRAAEAAGGDFRGRQSAALLVVEADMREESWQGVAVDVRVDDDAEPLDRLERLLDVAEAYEAMRVGTAAAKSGDLDQAARLAQRAASLAPHDQNVVAWVAMVHAQAGDLEPLRELIERRPGTRRLLDWLRAHDEVQLSGDVMAQLEG